MAMLSEVCSVLADTWQSWDTAPKDGRWIIALCNDQKTLMKVSWGRARDGGLWWCTADSSYGDGLFSGWINWSSGAQQ